MAKDGYKIRALIADDNRVMRSLIRSSFPYGPDQPEFQEAADGAEAVKAYKAGRFDILLLDFLKPRLDGLEVILDLRIYDPDAFVVMISGEFTPELAELAAAAGAVRLVHKPVNQKVASDILRAYRERVRRPAAILTVDVSPEIVVVLTQALRFLGIEHRMFLAETAKTALRTFELAHVDMMFVDPHFEDDGGLALMRQIKKTWPRTYVIAFSDDGVVETVLKARRQGADDYLLKTVDLIQLSKVWNRFLVSIKEELATGPRPVPTATAGEE